VSPVSLIPNLMSPVTEPDPDRPCLADPTPRMIMIVVARLVDTVLVVMVIVIEAHPVVAIMMMIVADTVLLQELVVPLMIIHPRVAGSRILIVVNHTLILTSMAGLLMIDLHQEITLQGIILQRITIVLAVTDCKLRAAIIRSGIIIHGAFLHKRPKASSPSDPNGCDVDNDFPFFSKLLAEFRSTKVKHSLVMYAGGKGWSL